MSLGGYSTSNKNRLWVEVEAERETEVRADRFLALQRSKPIYYGSNFISSSRRRRPDPNSDNEKHSVPPTWSICSSSSQRHNSIQGTSKCFPKSVSSATLCADFHRGLTSGPWTPTVLPGRGLRPISSNLTMKDDGESQAKTLWNGNSRIGGWKNELKMMVRLFSHLVQHLADLKRKWIERKQSFSEPELGPKISEVQNIEHLMWLIETVHFGFFADSTLSQIE